MSSLDKCLAKLYTYSSDASTAPDTFGILHGLLMSRSEWETWHLHLAGKELLHESLLVNIISMGWGQIRKPRLSASGF